METVVNSTLTSEEMDALKDIQKRSQVIIDELGQIELLKIQVEERRKQAEDYLASLKEDELKFSTNLSQKYGDCNINPTTGEISPF
jgi:hypothetical protein